MVKGILNRLSTKANQIRFNREVMSVKSTPPIKAVIESEVLIVSQLHHEAVYMALVAIKSFVYHFGSCNVEIINDGSLTDDDIDVVRQHIDGVTIVDIADIALFSCPKGGTWERLSYLLQRTTDYYVIQLDSDTVTLGALPEIMTFVGNNQAFTVGGPMFPAAIPVDYMSQLASKWDSSHIQVKAEKHLDKLKTLDLCRYLRGCSAFTGFPKGCNLLGKLSAVSTTMESYLGKDAWTCWGTEQFTSNVMQSYCTNSQVLGWPKYQNHRYPKFDGEKYQLTGYLGKVSVVHFIGSVRFSSNIYTKIVRHVIGNLNRTVSS